MILTNDLLQLFPGAIPGIRSIQLQYIIRMLLMNLDKCPEKHGLILKINQSSGLYNHFLLLLRYFCLQIFIIDRI